MPRAVVLCCALLTLISCISREQTKQYPIDGQILAVAPDRQEITLKHHDIKGFMPGMTMPFKVQKWDEVKDAQPGDLIEATLNVGEVHADLSGIRKTGHEALASPPPAAAPEVLKTGDVVADAPFLDEHGMPRNLRDMRGHRLAVTFIYTRCPVPDFCPLMNRHFATMQETLRARTDLADVRLLSITLDPEYDRPPVLAAHARLFQADPAVWSFLTAQPDVMKTFAAQFGIYSETDTENPAQIIHNLRTAVVDADGRLVTAISGNEWTPMELLADLTKARASVH